jgi:hypothetical protein
METHEPSEPQPPRPGAPPSLGQHLKWSLALVAACVVIAKLAIPLMHWLGFDSR